MPLFKRSDKPKTPAPVRTPRPRVRLSRDEIRSTNKIQPLETKIAWVLAAYGTIGLIAVRSRAGFTGDEWIIVAMAVAVGAAMALCAKYTNRIGTSMSAMAFVLPPWWGTFALAGYPFLIFFGWLMLRQSSARRKLLDARIASGDLGRSPSARNRRDERRPTDAVDATGKRIAEPSRRYTPPKSGSASKRR